MTVTPIVTAADVPDALKTRTAALFVRTVEVAEMLDTVLHDYTAMRTVELLSDDVDDRPSHLEREIGMEARSFGTYVGQPVARLSRI